VRGSYPRSGDADRTISWQSSSVNSRTTAPPGVSSCSTRRSLMESPPTTFPLLRRLVRRCAGAVEVVAVLHAEAGFYLPNPCSARFSLSVFLAYEASNRSATLRRASPVRSFIPVTWRIAYCLARLRPV
jgi:hypothetical protein